MSENLAVKKDLSSPIVQTIGGEPWQNPMSPEDSGIIEKLRAKCEEFNLPTVLIEDPLHVKTSDIEEVTAHIGNLSEKFSIRVQLRGLVERAKKQEKIAREELLMRLKSMRQRLLMRLKSMRQRLLMRLKSMRQRLPVRLKSVRQRLPVKIKSMRPGSLVKLENVSSNVNRMMLIITFNFNWNARNSDLVERLWRPNTSSSKVSVVRLEVKLLANLLVLSTVLLTLKRKEAPKTWKQQG